MAADLQSLHLTGSPQARAYSANQLNSYASMGKGSNGHNGGHAHSTSTSPSLSPKSSPLHSSNDQLNSSASVCSSGTGSVSACSTGSSGSLQNSSGVSVSSFSTTSSSGGSNLSLADYLSQLIKDKKQLQPLPKIFYHVERLLEEEISKVRINLFHMNGGKDPLVLPEEQGAQVTLTEKVYVPVKDYPDFNFVGRILGPRGLTAKELEKQTGCKIMIRGKGSMRDKNKESQNKGKPNWDHLNDELHVLITVEDTPERARLKMARATVEIEKMLVPLSEADDELKKRQLMELAILNGTYRDGSPKPAPPTMMNPVPTSQYYLNPSAFLPANVALAGQIRQQLAGNSLILNSNRPTIQTSMNGPQHQLFASGTPSPFNMTDAGFLFAPYDYSAFGPSLAASILNGDYGMDLTGQVGGVTKHKRQSGTTREHPYARTAAAAAATTGGATVQGATTGSSPATLFPSTGT